MSWWFAAVALLIAASVVAVTARTPWVLAAGAGVSTWTGARALALVRESRPPRDRVMWAWCAWALTALAAGFVLEAVARLGIAVGWWHAPVEDVGLTLGVTVCCALSYQGLVRWNRFRTALSDPGDWLNGVSAVVAIAAVANFAAERAGWGLGQPWWVLQGQVLRVSCVLTLLGTALTVVFLARLLRDLSAWFLVGVLSAVAAVEVGSLAVGAVDGSPLAVVTWAWMALGVALAFVLPTAEAPAAGASSQSTTAGALVVLISGIAILVLGAFTPGDQRAASVLAASASLGASVRVLRLMHELAQLASSREEARTDPLTGVANRRALMEAVDTLSFAPQGAGLLVVDLDRFKDINDRFGHAAGDEVIRTLASRLRDQLGERGLLARLGGDEFAVVLQDPDPGRALDIARELRTVVSEPVATRGRLVRLNASIGVASTALGAHRDGELMRCADAAMYLAKHTGAGVSLYDEEVDARSRDRNDLVEELRSMLEGGASEFGALVMYFQPQLDARTGDVVGAEALVRWQHPTRGVLSPAEFVDLAEEHGLMTALTGRVLAQSTRQAAVWRARGRDLTVAVNLSTSCLEYPGLLDVIDDALSRTGLPADRLVVEITETTLMHDPQLAIDVTRTIAGRGIGVSIDDYGTGYSSLAYLNDLPATELKLDRSFTARLTADPRTRAIVSGTVDLAHHLGLRLIAEGVEDHPTRHALRDLGCDRTQGYLHARPMPADVFLSWLDALAVRDTTSV